MAAAGGAWRGPPPDDQADSGGSGKFRTIRQILPDGQSHEELTALQRR